MVGQTLAHYEILEKLGQGGMGEVYLAHDTKLNRRVAVKVLPDDLASDEERLSRFQREATLLASLNHPNIATIHALEDVSGQKLLVMELVEGRTLSELGRLSLDEALPLFEQLAEGLAAAHDRGILHRDLKPANVMVTHDDQIKILDFGLAKALGEADENFSVDSSASPTRTKDTALGAILGTASYMSPEQARGKPVDKRADVWAFGCCLYESLTGHKAFEGETVTDTLAAVMTREPDLSSVPERARGLVERCLRKSVSERLRDVGDAHLLLRDDARVARAGRPSRAWLVAAGAAVVVAGLLGFSFRGPPEPERPLTRLAIRTPAHVTLTNTNALALSPDGRSIVYHTGEGGGHQFFLQRLDELEPALLFSSPTWLGNPFFSPDGKWVGMTTYTDQMWSKISVLGGAPVKLFPSPSPPLGASWGLDGTIVFAMSSPGLGLFRGSADGGDPEVLTTPDRGNGEIAHQWPEFLPGGDAVLFTVMKESPQIAVLELGSGTIRVLLPRGQNARYASTGHLVYGFDGTLHAAPFDPEHLEVTGDPVSVIEGVVANESGGLEFALSTDGSLVYLTGEAEAGAGRSLVWVDRQSREEALPVQQRAYRVPRISPDGTRLAVDARDGGQDIWIWNFGRETMSRLTFDPDDDASPAWSPDGERVVFSSSREGGDRIYAKAADGSGAVEPVTEDEGRHQSMAVFTPQGDRLVLQEQQPGDAKRFRDFRVLSLEGGGAPEPLLASDFIEVNPDLSPDGRWLVYQSDETGRFEIYVRPFPAVDQALHRVSTTGGTHPAWARDGSELFYLGSNGALMSVAVREEPELSFGTAEVVVARRYYTPTSTDGRPYDVSPDGKRFLMIKEPAAETSGIRLILVQNWGEELKRLVPTN